MSTQTEQTPRSAKPRANSHTHIDEEMKPEIASKVPIKVAGSGVAPVTEEQRRELIALAAYYLAERRNFEPGHETEDWLAAESQILRLGTLNS